MESRDHEVGIRPDADRLAGAHAQVNRSLSDLFGLLREVDTEESVTANAMTDAVAWLQFDLGLAPRTARAWVRAAHALENLPQIAAAFRAGEVSVDEVLILIRHATADNEAALLGLTRQVPVEDLAATIRELFDAPKPEKTVWEKTPVLTSWWDEDVFHLRGSIPGADGVLVDTTLRRLSAQAPTDPGSGLFRDPTERAGEALVQLASEAAAEDRDHDRATVVIHLDLDQLVNAAPHRVFNLGGTEYSREELLRLGCDGRIQPAIDHAGVTVGVGRTSRQIPFWLRRLLTNRDHGCRFPGCRRTRWTHAHHIHHWADGGATNLDNLITLCGFHHRLVHRRNWQIEGNPNRTVTFITEWGTPHQPIRRVDQAWHDHLVHQIEHTYRPHLLGLLATANAPP